MAASLSQTQTSARAYQRGNIAILLGLLVLRFPVQTLTAVFLGGTPGWAIILYWLGTYLLTAWLIWRERARLRDFHIDVVAAVMFVCQRFLFLIGLGLWAQMLRKKQRFPAPPPGIARWLLGSAAIALGVMALTQLAGLNWNDPRGPTPPDLRYLTLYPLMQLSNAALMEEPLFRGFLWGYLRKAGWRDVWVWLFQAALFTLGHIYYLHYETVPNYLIRLLIPSLILGLIAWKSRSIAASMTAHAFFNAAGDLMIYSNSLAGAYRLALTAMAACAGGMLLLTLLSQWKGRQGTWQYI